MEVASVVPLLRIFDVAKAKEFYVEFLGFEVDWEHAYEPGMPIYMQVSRGNKLVLHLTEHHGDCCPGSTVYIQVSKGLEEFHKEISAKGYQYAKPGIELEEWGEKSVQVGDPFGNKLRFCEKIRKAEGQLATGEGAVVEKFSSCAQRSERNLLLIEQKATPSPIPYLQELVQTEHARNSSDDQNSVDTSCRFRGVN